MIAPQNPDKNIFEISPSPWVDHSNPFFEGISNPKQGGGISITGQDQRLAVGARKTSKSAPLSENTGLSILEENSHTWKAMKMRKKN